MKRPMGLLGYPNTCFWSSEFNNEKEASPLTGIWHGVDSKIKVYGYLRWVEVTFLTNKAQGTTWISSYKGLSQPLYHLHKHKLLIFINRKVFSLIQDIFSKSVTDIWLAYKAKLHHDKQIDMFTKSLMTKTKSNWCSRKGQFWPFLDLTSGKKREALLTSA